MAPCLAFINPIQSQRHSSAINERHSPFDSAFLLQGRCRRFIGARSGLPCGPYPIWLVARQSTGPQSVARPPVRSGAWTSPGVRCSARSCRLVDVGSQYPIDSSAAAGWPVAHRCRLASDFGSPYPSQSAPSLAWYAVRVADVQFGSVALMRVRPGDVLRWLARFTAPMECASHVSCGCSAALRSRSLRLVTAGPRGHRRFDHIGLAACLRWYALDRSRLALGCRSYALDFGAWLVPCARPAAGCSGKACEARNVFPRRGCLLAHEGVSVSPGRDVSA
jgi:hypothetical protein